MADITASMVKDLRAKTGAGMMDCKKALSEVDGDIESAIDWLRKAGLAAAAKKAGRTAAEGLVAAIAETGVGAVIEINAETDFVARNDQFQNYATNVAKMAISTGDDMEVLNSARLDNGTTVAETLTNLVATIGENMSLRRATVLKVGSGVVSTYVHNTVAPGLGKIGALVALESGGEVEKLDALGKQLAMHVAAAAPQWCSVEDVEDSSVDRERAVLAEQARQSGKPEEIIEKMVEGRLRKFFEEVVFEEQVFVVDGETKIKKVIENAEKALGVPIKLKNFERFVLGEGIEKEEADFASEVAAVVKS